MGSRSRRLTIVTATLYQNPTGLGSSPPSQRERRQRRGLSPSPPPSSTGCAAPTVSTATAALRSDALLASVDLGLPDSVHGLVLSRLDRLPDPVKLTLKVASVIGRVFELDLLRDAHPATVEHDALEGQLSTLAQRHFARLETPAPQVAYIFKHNITQEAVYQTLLHSQQQTLHGRVARALEALRPDAVERLAHHFHSGDLARPTVRRQALHYLDAAAHHAQRDYANETALAQLDRALALETRWGWLKTKIEVLHLLGRREEERAVLEQLAQVENAPPL